MTPDFPTKSLARRKRCAFFVPGFRLRRVSWALNNNTKRSHIWPTKIRIRAAANRSSCRHQQCPTRIFPQTSPHLGGATSPLPATPTRNRTKHPKSIHPQKQHNTVIKFLLFLGSLPKISSPTVGRSPRERRDSPPGYYS